MRISTLLSTLRQRGVFLQADGAKLRYRARPGVVDSELRADILANKRPLLDALSERQAAYEEWKAALKQISRRWNRAKAQSGDAPFLPADKDSRLTDAVADAIRARDLPRARRAIHAWKAAWLKLLGPSGSADAACSPSVALMFDELRSRRGERADDEGTLTGWISQNAPEVAKQWPDAPQDASWLDWRRRTGRTNIDILDRAYSAVVEAARARRKPSERR